MPFHGHFDSWGFGLYIGCRNTSYGFYYLCFSGLMLTCSWMVSVFADCFFCMRSRLAKCSSTFLWSWCGAIFRITAKGEVWEHSCFFSCPCSVWRCGCFLSLTTHELFWIVFERSSKILKHFRSSLPLLLAALIYLGRLRVTVSWEIRRAFPPN